MERFSATHVLFSAAQNTEISARMTKQIPHRIENQNWNINGKIETKDKSKFLYSKSSDLIPIRTCDIPKKCKQIF